MITEAQINALRGPENICMFRWPPPSVSEVPDVLVRYDSLILVVIHSTTLDVCFEQNKITIKHTVQRGDIKFDMIWQSCFTGVACERCYMIGTNNLGVLVNLDKLAAVITLDTDKWMKLYFSDGTTIQARGEMTLIRNALQRRLLGK